MLYLELAGFGSVALIRSSDLRFDLLSALVERWRPETYTFHLPCGECTVTLEDVALQLGLSIDGSPVTGVSSFTDPAALCYQLLGEPPEDGDKYFSGIKFTWLKAKIGQLSATATEGELMCAARAYIMHMIGAVIMPDANSDSVHLSYLPLLADLSTARSYSWGSAVLATLYRELCQVTELHVKDIGRCLILLQSWALYRMPFLASVSHQPYLYPLPLRWTTRPGIGRSCDVPIYRLRIEQHAREGFIWMPYRRPEITNVVPSSALVDSHIWCTNTLIINFNVVEWYHGDRVLRQFGCIQPIPDLPCQVGEDHSLTKRGRFQLDWGIKYRKLVALWNDRLRQIPQMVMATDLQPSLEYTQWYYSCGKPYLLGGQLTVIPPYV
ncbi:serine/threonine-protein phosphatase 7 long form homolog [Gossypium raimondii]|uniref:serine/threonine-protein phosphatase 7 long form homolog n=1 Tax=Gossypium raimondii TaxID=29730 RepID=UPI00227CECF0|nr:serine/threonine-protein phosphatase 7 long form homolog [Gossypium raimondii]